MSYNITTTITLSSTLRITREAAEELRTQHKRCLPEVHFLQPLRFPEAFCGNGHKVVGAYCSKCGAKAGDDASEALITNFAWSGMGSNEPANLALAASFTTGEAEVVRIWEGGDLIDGIWIRNGKVSVHKVTLSLEHGGRPLTTPKDQP
jgi:hypothetical protein